MRRHLTLLALLLYQTTVAQSLIRIMSYNLMHYPGTKYYNTSSHQWEDRTPVLKDILDEAPPDILAVCEMQEAPAAAFLLDNALNANTADYLMANFEYNQSGSSDLQQMLYYRGDKFELTGQDIIPTPVRDINRYSLKTKTPTPLYIDIFVAHLKSSAGENNEYTRLQMVQQFTAYLDNIPPDHYVVFAGDLNLYSADEPAYQELLDDSNAVVLLDPAEAPVAWHNNYEYQYLHTQSTLTDNSHFLSESGGYDGATGGMDDRFDFILLSENFFDGPDMFYAEGSYAAFGNNGNCYNKPIDDPDCSGEYSQELRDKLANMSDHLPVILSIELSQNIGISSNGISRQWYLTPSWASDEVLVHFPGKSLSYRLVNNTGQCVISGTLTSRQARIDIRSLPPGVYYLQTIENSLFSPLVLIKK